MVFRLLNSLILSALAIAVVLWGEVPVSIRVSATTFFANSDLVVTCKVPRQEDNRLLVALIAMEGDLEYTSSQHELDGDRAMITHRFEFKQIPCGTTAAACILTDKYQRSFPPAVQRLNIAGCDAQ